MKLDSNELDKLILEALLTERNFSVDLGSSVDIPGLDTDKEADRKKITDPPLTKAEIEDLINQQQSNDNLGANDLETAFKKASSDKSFKAADQVLKKGVTTAIKTAAAQALSKANPELYGKVTATGDVQTGLDIDSRAAKLKPAGMAPGKYTDVSTSTGIKDLMGKPLTNVSGVTIDSSLQATVEAIQGDTYLEKIQTIQQDFEKLEAGGGENAQPADIAKLANSLLYLQLFADALQEYEASAAGTAFETLLAFLSKGIVVGGESGAVDVLAQDTTLISAKFYSNNDVSQALGKTGGIGITGIVKDEAMEMVYIVGMKATSRGAQGLQGVTSGGKTTKAGAFSADTNKVKAIDLYALRIKWTDQGYKVYSVPDDSFLGRVPTSKPRITKLKLNYPLAKAIKGKHRFASIPVLPMSGAVANGTEYLNNVVKGYNNELLKKITNIYKRLQNLNSNTQEYVAKKSDDKKPDVTAHLTAIRNDYDKMGEEYTDVTKTFGKTFQENKQKTLDKLIEEVILEEYNGD